MKMTKKFTSGVVAVLALFSVVQLVCTAYAEPSPALTYCTKEAKIGVLIIHGMGAQETDFADAFIQEVNDRLMSSGLKKTDVCWKPVYWANILSEDEDNLWNALSLNGGLHWASARKYVINAVGDALAYQFIPDESDCSYNLIHERVHESILEMRNDFGGKDKPIIVIAHSMGSVIMSDYIYDRQNPDDDSADPYGKTPLERMETLAGFITFGSPLPLYTLAYETIPCIQFPPDTLPKNLKEKARWLNFYDPSDILGWPLEYLKVKCKGRVKDCVIEDRQINVGGMLTYWDPLCHSKYWTDNDFTKPVAQYISEILRICP